MQQALNREGYSLDVDGGFGKKTLAALMDYQRRVGMTPDGVAGSKTWASLGVQSAQDRLADLEKGYTPSRETQDAKRSWEELAANQPGDYTSPYTERMEELLRQMEGRGPFAYDPSRDDTFQRYARLYQRQGQTAMEDALGQAAGLTGGYDSTYAQQAGQQEYGRYMQELAALVPQLQQNAWDRYESQGQALLDQYKLLQGQDASAYDQWRDQVEDWQNASRQARDRYESLEKQDYSNYLALMKYYASRAKQEQDAALAQQKLESTGKGGGSSRSSAKSGGKKTSLSSAASESLERTMNRYLGKGDTRQVKKLFMQYRDRNFVQFSRCVGMPERFILFRHLLPSITSDLAVLASLDVGWAIINISTLSFLGLGVQAPTPEWGAMLNEAKDVLTSNPTQMIAPGIAIVVLVCCFNLMGDALRDVLDPKEVEK